MHRLHKSVLISLPACLAGDVDDAADLTEAIHIAKCQLDIIAEGQDGTDHYTPADVREIRNWIREQERPTRASIHGSKFAVANRIDPPAERRSALEARGFDGFVYMLKSSSSPAAAPLLANRYRSTGEFTLVDRIEAR